VFMEVLMNMYRRGNQRDSNGNGNAIDRPDSARSCDFEKYIKTM
jgi:hypothetical protein